MRPRRHQKYDRPNHGRIIMSPAVGDIHVDLLVVENDMVESAYSGESLSKEKRVRQRVDAAAAAPKIRSA